MLCKRWVGHGITVNLANLWTKGFDCGAHFKGCLSSVTFQVEVSSHGSPKVGLRDRIHWSVRCSGFRFFLIKPFVHVLCDRQVKSVTKDGEKNS